MPKKRYLEPFITDDLAKKMVFVGGPRQVGKTTMAKTIGGRDLIPSEYLNWDSRPDRQKILKERFNPAARLLIFDELHKYRPWKTYLKGLYDTAPPNREVLVTGSARLDLYRRGGDSLQGRYHYYRLHPFSVAELNENTPDATVMEGLRFTERRDTVRHYKELLQYGGFPEPLFAKNERTQRRWQNERVDRLIKEDVREIELVRDLSGLQVLNEIIPGKVGALFSLNSIREDLGVTHKTASLWVDILERFYYHFRVYPYQTTIIKTLRKEPKIYLWDWSALENPAARLENIIASHLLKFTHWHRDVNGHQAELFYLRDREGREVDFLVTVKRRPWFMVEVKQSDTKPAATLNYFRERLKIPFSYQVIGENGIDWQQGGARVISADKFLGGLV